MFWGDFTKNQHHDGQTGGGNRDPGFAPHVDGQYRGDGGGENVDDIVANQNGAEQAIWAA